MHLQCSVFTCSTHLVALTYSSYPMSELSVLQYCLIALIFIWSGFVRSGLGFGGAVLSLLFLLMYIAYHITSDPTPYGGEGVIRYVYFFILITHILLSVALIPLVLFSYKHAALRDFKAHKRLSKVTFPIWLYVAVTGVVVYLMIAPYYV